MTRTPVTNVARDPAEVSAKVAEMVRGIRTCMMTNLTPEGHLQSRPMMLQELDEHGDLWFFASLPSEKTLAIELEENVNLAFASPERQNFVSIAGIAEVIQDEVRAQELWNPTVQAWYPGGPRDPELALLRVKVHSAEYWDSPSSSVVQVFGLAKALVTGKRPQLGKNERTGEFQTSGDARH